MPDHDACETEIRILREVRANLIRERDGLQAEVERLRLCANSARVCLERFRMRPGSTDLLATAIRELDEALEERTA